MSKFGNKNDSGIELTNSPGGGGGGSHSELGMMPSMSSECTPSKYRYDQCFNRWFEDYLGLTNNSKSSTKNEAKSSGGGFWSSSSRSTSNENNTSSPLDAIQGGIQRSPNERKALKERLEGECGAFWKEYQSCVMRAVKERDLEGLIKEAKSHNPFPFPKDVPQNQSNNEPFPFPAANQR